jgi:hypothetical protein
MSASEITDFADQETIITISQNKETLTRSKSDKVSLAQLWLNNTNTQLSAHGKKR